jgi:hypothetical protein
MTIRLGDIELISLQAVEVDEGRSLVEHAIPGGTGSLFQDLGRRPMTLSIAGMLLGEPSLRQIERLRAAHADSTPLRFSADIAVGSELTDVIIEDLDIQQVPGHKYRYEFLLRIREWTEPPEPIGAAAAAVDAEVAADAAAWNEQALAIAGALDDPGALGELLASNPEFLSRIGLDDLAKSVSGSLGTLGSGEFAKLMEALKKIDPQKVIGFVQALAEADSLEDLFHIMTGSGIDLLEQLTGLDLSEASPLIRAFLGGPQFIDKLASVRDAAQALLDDVRAFRPLDELKPLLERPNP